MLASESELMDTESELSDIGEYWDAIESMPMEGSVSPDSESEPIPVNIASMIAFCVAKWVRRMLCRSSARDEVRGMDG